MSVSGRSGRGKKRSGKFFSEERRNIGIQTVIYDDISPDIEAMMLEKEDADVTLNVSGKIYQVHKFILKARSPVFGRIFRHNMAERRSGEVTIPDCDPDAFEAYLLYLYSGRLDHVTLDNVVPLYYIADKYEAEKLATHCLNTMEANLVVENFAEFVSVVLLGPGDPNFLQAAVEFFANNFEAIDESPGWKQFFHARPQEAHEFVMKAFKYKASGASVLGEIEGNMVF